MPSSAQLFGPLLRASALGNDDDFALLSELLFVGPIPAADLTSALPTQPRKKLLLGIAQISSTPKARPSTGPVLMVFEDAHRIDPDLGAKWLRICQSTGCASSAGAAGQIHLFRPPNFPPQPPVGWSAPTSTHEILRSLALGETPTAEGLWATLWPPALRSHRLEDRRESKSLSPPEHYGCPLFVRGNGPRQLLEKKRRAERKPVGQPGAIGAAKSPACPAQSVPARPLCMPRLMVASLPARGPGAPRRPLRSARCSGREFFPL